MRERMQVWGLTVALATIVALVLAACGAGSGTQVVQPRDTKPVEDVDMQATQFKNVNSMTKVRGFYVDNVLGHIEQALRVAKSRDGGVYPVGTVIQLVPQEAMVKHRKGFNPATRDWEFFFLDVTAQGTTIVNRGTTDVVNRFGFNCASCHSAAEPKFDGVCEDDHGCAPLSISDELIAAFVAGDPRPVTMPGA